MHPDLIQIGSIQISSYGAAFSFALLFGSLLSFMRARKEGINEEIFLAGLLLAMVGVIVCSKGMHILVNLSEYIESPKKILNFKTGHVFYGGYIGAVVFPWVYMRIIKEPFLPKLDIAATYMGLGLAIHRAFGCFNAGCCHGAPSDVAWAVIFPVGSPAFHRFGEVAVHPTQLYEAFLALMIFAVMLYWRKYHKKVAGELITLQIAIYAVGRFIIEFFRGDDARGLYGPLSTSQWISIGMLVGVAIMTRYLLVQRRKLEHSKKTA